MSRKSNKRRSTRLTRSNNAHLRLCSKHRRIAKSSIGRNYDVALVKQNYHYNVVHNQKKLGRVLNDDEKKRVYNKVIRDFY